MPGLCLIYWSCQAQKLWAEAVDKALNLLIFSAAGGAGAALCAGREDLPQGWVGSWAQLLQEPLQPVWEKAPGAWIPSGPEFCKSRGPGKAFSRVVYATQQPL